MGSSQSVVSNNVVPDKTDVIVVEPPPMDDDYVKTEFISCNYDSVLKELKCKLEKMNPRENKIILFKQNNNQSLDKDNVSSEFKQKLIDEIKKRQLRKKPKFAISDNDLQEGIRKLRKTEIKTTHYDDLKEFKDALMEQIKQYVNDTTDENILFNYVMKIIKGEQNNCILCLYGTGSNGKSTFLKWLFNTIGGEVFDAAAVRYSNKYNTFNVIRGADFVNKSLAISCIDDYIYFPQMNIINDITSRKTLHFESIHGELYATEPECNVILHTNNKEHVRYLQNVMIIHFRKEFEKNEKIIT